MRMLDFAPRSNIAYNIQHMLTQLTLNITMHYVVLGPRVGLGI